MSIIRDLLEYYRLPAVVQLHQDDFEVSHNLLNGYEERFYYDKDTDFDGLEAVGTPYRMVVDQFTEDTVRFRRTLFFYDDDFVLTSIRSEYENGEKTKDEVYTYGTANEIINITSVESDSAITWTDMPVSTGWPPGGFNQGGLIWTRENTNQPNTEPFHGYLMDTSVETLNCVLPLDPDEGDTIAFADAEGTFNQYNFIIYRNGKKIMGLEEEITLNENHQGVQLVYDGVDSWTIVWTTPLIANITVPAGP